MNFGNLEDVLSSCIAYLLGTKPRKGLIVTSEMSFQAKLHVLASLVREEYKSAELAIGQADFSDLVYMCSKSEQLRNQILHSSWVYDHSKQTCEIRRRKISAKFRQGYKQHEEPLTPAQVLDIADYIITSAVFVEEFIGGCFNAYSRLLERVIHA